MVETVMQSVHITKRMAVAMSEDGGRRDDCGRSMTVKTQCSKVELMKVVHRTSLRGETIRDS